MDLLINLDPNGTRCFPGEDASLYSNRSRIMETEWYISNPIHCWFWTTSTVRALLNLVLRWTEDFWTTVSACLLVFELVDAG